MGEQCPADPVAAVHVASQAALSSVPQRKRQPDPPAAQVVVVPAIDTVTFVALLMTVIVPWGTITMDTGWFDPPFSPQHVANSALVRSAAVNVAVRQVTLCVVVNCAFASRHIFVSIFTPLADGWMAFSKPPVKVFATVPQLINAPFGNVKL
jgi:hypothetical protein